MIIVVSPQQDIHQETVMVNAMLRHDVLYHIRKYDKSDEELISYAAKINPEFKDRLVLHSHHHLAEYLGISRLHFSERDREGQDGQLSEQVCVISTSVHSIETFNELGSEWHYAFISPLFPSISKKGYGAGSQVLESLSSRRRNGICLIGLGGINGQNCRRALEAGADGVALLGAVWDTPDPPGVLEKIISQLNSGRI